MPVSPLSARSRLFYVPYLPAEVPDQFVKAVLSSFGTAGEVTAMEYSGFPGLLNGTRLVEVTLEKDTRSSGRIT